MLRKITEQNQAIQLRRAGISIREIARRLKISSSSASIWCKNVKLTVKQRALLASKSQNIELLQYYARKRHLDKITSQETIFKKASQDISQIDIKQLFITGIALYWAEGSKKDFGLSNTDPKLVRVFVDGLRRLFGLTNDDFTISIRIYEDLDRKNCLRFWSRVTRVPLGSRTSVNVLTGSKHGKLQYGMCRIRIKKGGLYLKEVFSMIEAIDQIIVPS